MRIEIYSLIVNKATRFEFAAVAKNGNIIAVSYASYAKHANCLRAAKKFAAAFKDPVIIDHTKEQK